MPATPYSLATLCLLGLAVLSLWVAPAPYLHDFGEWLFQSQVLVQRWIEPDLVSLFVWAPYPVPNSLAVVLLALLGLLFPGFVAGKVFLSLLLLAWYPVLRQLLGRSGWRKESLPAMLALLCCLLALSNFFWTGFVAYQLGILLLCWFLARFDDQTGPLEIAAFGVTLFFAHAMPLLVFGLIVMLDWLQRPGRWQRLLALVPTLVLGLWFILGRRALEFEAPVADATFAGWREILVYKLGFPLLLGPFRNLLWPDQASLLDGLPALYWAGVATNALTVAGAGLLVLLALIPDSGADDDAQRMRRTLRRGVALLVLCYLLAPYNFFGLINPAGRLLIPILVLAVMLMAASDRRPSITRVVRWLAPLVLVFSLLVTGTYGWMMTQAGSPAEMTIPRPAGRPPSQSVLAYNDWVYAQARHRHFNVRIFTFARRLQQVAESDYRGLGFRTGLLIDYRAPDREADSQP